jgi:hypothetical protein
MGRLGCALSVTLVSRFHRHDTAVMSSFVLCLINPSSNHFSLLFLILVLEGPRETKYVRPNEIMVRSMTSDSNCAHCYFIRCEAMYLGTYLPNYTVSYSRRLLFMARSAARVRARLPYPTDNVDAFTSLCAPITECVLFKFVLLTYTVQLGYNDLGLCDTTSIA